MASGLLRVVLSRAVIKRSVHVSALNNIYTFHPPAVGPDPNINMEFYESRTTPLPVFPRTVGFEGELKVLKEKEKGDWKNLSNEERMDLYNLYFSMSMADMCRDTDEYKSVAGVVMILISFTLLIHWFIHVYVLPPYVESAVDPEWVQAAIKKQLQFHAGPVTGYASMWDYENNCWKK